MISIAFRKYEFKVKETDGKKYIFDEIRKKYILLTPEEWVRQNIVHHLVYDLNYNKSRISLEKEFEVNKLKKRFDILIFDKEMNVFMIIECKAPEIKITQHTAKQIFNYNIKFNAKYLLLTNGLHSFCLGNNKQWLENLPEYL